MSKTTKILALTLLFPACTRDTIDEPAQPEAAAVSAAATPTVPGATRGLLDAPVDNPEEFGAVNWGRDLDAALAASKTSGKPVFLLFTEVPGCSTVRGFANGPLRHPLVVEAIETEFEPVVVRNNVMGAERKILNSFNEPTWNNPVVRFLDHNRKDLVDRFARGWTEEGLTKSMVEALRKADRPVPGYLVGLHDELSAETKTSVFSMYCFWTGEVKLAGLPGVVSTRPGFANGREVVEVTWDARATTQKDLFTGAAKAQAATGVLLTRASDASLAKPHFRDVELLKGDVRYSEKDDKYQIRNRKLGTVPMTPAQATAVNRAVTRNPSEVQTILSPRQLAFSQNPQRGSSILSAPRDE